MIFVGETADSPTGDNQIQQWHYASQSELIKQAEILFGEPMTRRLEEPADSAPATDAGTDAPAGPEDQQQAAAEAAPDNVPPMLKVRMTMRQQRRLWKHVESIENFWRTLKELEPGVIERLAALAAERRWEIIFLTKRPESAGETAQVQSQRWLQSHGFPLPSVFVVQGSRGRIAAALGIDIVIDDRPENCLDVVVDSKARAVLVWRDDEKNLPAAARRLGIGVVKTVEECLEVLIQIDTPAREQSGVMNRVKRLLGLKEPANA
jgi:hypothetical protein